MGCFSSKVKVQGEKPKEPTYKGKYKFFGPSISGDVYTTDYENLYRVSTGDTWYFYNDTSRQEFDIRIDFGPDTDIVQAGTKSKSGRTTIAYHSGRYDGGARCTVTVYPFETVPFVKFKGEKDIDCYDDSYNCSYIKTKFINDKIALSRETLKKSYQFIIALLDVNPSMPLDELLDECVMKEVQFVDSTFSPSARSIERPDEDPHEIDNIDAIKWIRSVDIVPAELKSKVGLYRRGIKPKWVVQGAIGDCWFISAITIVSQQSPLTRQLFKHPISASCKKKERKVGAYRVWLNLGGWWTNVIVDNYLPSRDLAILFANSRSDPFSLWVPLIEKAYAKAYGSYAAIVGGRTGDGIRDLTGFPYFDIDPETCVEASRFENRAEDFFADLRNWINRKFVISIGTPGTDTSSYVIKKNVNNDRADCSSSSAGEEEEEEEDSDDEDDNANDNDDRDDDQVDASSCDSSRAEDYDFKDEIYETDSENLDSSSDADRTWTCPSPTEYKKMGLVMGHAYCILDSCKLPGSSIRLVKVRNPHGGSNTWKGKWGNTSKVWKKHPILKMACNPNTKDDDGTFWMDWRDTVKWFHPSCFSVNMLKPKWRDYRVKGEFRNHKPSVVLRIDVEEDKDIPFYFTISFKSRRGTKNAHDSFCKLLLSWDDYEEENDGMNTEVTYMQVGHRKVPLYRGNKMTPRTASNGEDEEDDEPTKQFLIAASSPNGDIPYDLLDEDDAEKVSNIYSDQVTMSYELQGVMSPYYLIPTLSPNSPDVPYVLGVFSPEKASASTYDVSFVQFPSTHPVFSGAKTFDYIDDDPENDKLITCDLQTSRLGRAPMNARGTSLLEYEEVPYGEE